MAKIKLFSAIFRWLDFFDSTNFWGRAEISSEHVFSITDFLSLANLVYHFSKLFRTLVRFATSGGWEICQKWRYKFWSLLKLQKKTFLDRLKETFLASKKGIHFCFCFYSSFQPDIELLYQNVDKSNREKLGTK